MTGSFNSKAFLCLTVAALLTLVQTPALADLVSTDQLVADAQTDARRAEISALLARSEVRAQMTEMGVDVEDAQNRVNQMTGSELAAVHSRLGSLPAGGEALGIVLTVLLIFILLELAGVTDVFPRL